MSRYLHPRVHRWPKAIGVPLLGGRLLCDRAEVIEWRPGAPRVSSWHDADRIDWPAAFTAPRAAPFDRPRLMGILNVTPDSFSDGGAHATRDGAVAHGLRLARQGADIVDVGGESTRPGATPVSVEEELRRVTPVVAALARAGVTVSIDTRKAEVMEAALAAGASIINDVSGLTWDRRSLEVVAGSEAFVVLMHMAGEPATMNEAPRYEACALEVFDWLGARVEACERAGIRRERIIVDPGLCFAKHEAHNLDLLRHLALYHGLGCPVLLGASRKGWTAELDREWPAGERLAASLVAAQWALDRGVQVLRVHDVAAHRQMLAAWHALNDLEEG
ncbi:MAG: dihydropteroate synthase [Geminicoccaceae bacterium]